MKSFRLCSVRLLAFLVGSVLVVIGSFVWTSRLSHFSPQILTQGRLEDQLVKVPSGRTLDLSDECTEAASGSGWILFVLEATLTNDDRFRTFFETAEERVGLWVEYEPGVLRLGLGLGLENVETNVYLPIRIVRHTERTTIFVAVKQDETRVVTNARDGRISWPGSRMSTWSCSTVRFADDVRELSSGNSCAQCAISLSYATGRDVAELDYLLDEVSNVRKFNLVRWTGTSLTLLGIVIFLLGIKCRRSRVRSEAQES